MLTYLYKNWFWDTNNKKVEPEDEFRKNYITSNEKNREGYEKILYYDKIIQSFEKMKEKVKEGLESRSCRIWK